MQAAVGDMTDASSRQQFISTGHNPLWGGCRFNWVLFQPEAVPVYCPLLPGPCKTPALWSNPVHWTIPPPHSSSGSASVWASGLEIKGRFFWVSAINFTCCTCTVMLLQNIFKRKTENYYYYSQLTWSHFCTIRLKALPRSQCRSPWRFKCKECAFL